MKFKVGSEDWLEVKLSPDGSHLFAHWRQGRIMRRIIDGHELPPATWLVGEMPEVIGPAEALNRFAWLDRAHDQMTMVVTDLKREKRLGPFEHIELSDSRFSDHGRHFTFVFSRASGRWVWFDGQEFGPYETVDKPWLFGSALAFSAQKHGQNVVWIGGREYAAYDTVFFPQVSPDGSFVFAFKRGVEYFFQTGKSVIGPFGDEPRKFGIGNKGRIAIERAVDGKVGVDVDGQRVWQSSNTSQEVASNLSSCFSPDAKRFGFAYQHGYQAGKYAGFCLDGECRDVLGYADGPWWSPDSSHVAWAADVDGGGLLVINGQETKLESRIDFEDRASFRFSPDGRFCCVLRDSASGKPMLRIGNEHFGPFHIGDSARHSQDEKVAFSDDGAHFAFKYLHEGPYAKLAYFQRDHQTFGPFNWRSQFALGADGTLYLAVFDPASLEVRLEKHPPV